MGKKGRRRAGSDDDPMLTQLAILSLENFDEELENEAAERGGAAPKKKEKTKGGKKSGKGDSDDDEPSAAAAGGDFSKGKKGGKKGKKGRGGDSADEEEDTEAAAPSRKDARKAAKNDRAAAAATPKSEALPFIPKEGKEKPGKKGFRKLHDEDEAPRSKREALVKAQEAASMVGADANDVIKTQSRKALKEKRMKGKQGGNNKKGGDSDNEDPLAIMKRLAGTDGADSDSEQDEEEASEEEESEDDVKYSKGKGSARGNDKSNGKGKDKDKDKGSSNGKNINKGTPAAFTAAFADSSEEEEEEEEKEETQSEEEAMPVVKTKRKKGWGEFRSKGEGKQKGGEGGTQYESEEEEKGEKEEDDEEEEEKDSSYDLLRDAHRECLQEEAVLKVRAASEDTNDSVKSSNDDSTDSDAEKDEQSNNHHKINTTADRDDTHRSGGGGKMSKAERRKAKAVAKAEDLLTPAEVDAAELLKKANEKRIETEKAAQSTAPKSKLQLKLEAAKAAKELRDKEEAEKVAVEAEIKAAEEKAQRKAERKAARALEKLEAAGGGDRENEVSSTLPSTPPASSKAAAVVAEETAAEYEARMMSTMYGDDVHSEWGRVNPDASASVEEGSPKLLTESGKKISRKELKKRAAEQESAAREAEYQKAAIKASHEGAQFAVSQTIIDPNDPLWQNSLDIVIPSISISAHSKELFVNTELTIAHGRRYGLVGPNGAGKSTLLKMISSGELKVPPRIDYLYVEQEVMADETPAVDAVLRADKIRWNLVQEEKEILLAIEKMGTIVTTAAVNSKERIAADKLDVRLGEVYEGLAACGAASAESRARRILFGLGFDAEMQVRPTKYFSGGWRMRISLARALFIEPTLLMLDEPTNHLDLNAVIWLDDYLQKWKKTLLVVSHDQDFLNSVCQEILHLEDKKIQTYKGNYDNFKEQECVRVKQQQKAWEKQERKLRELKAKGATKVQAEKAQIKNSKREPTNKASKKAEKAAAGSGGIESSESQIELIKRPREYTVEFGFPDISPISPPILEVRDVDFRYGPQLPLLFKGLNFGLDMDSRVCIVGPNGSGKSTIIKIITGQCEPPIGDVRRNPRLRVGVYDQHFVDRLPMEEDPVTYLRRLFQDETYQSIRNMLGRYGLEGHAHCIPHRDLSGGQKARVVLVELSLMAPHLLFLDEPTNNLDIESIDALCDALKAYQGGVILVSHDARLIETCECRLWVVEEQNITPWSTGFKGYREHLLKKLEEQLSSIIAGGGERPDERKEK